MPDDIPFLANTKIRFFNPSEGGIHVIARELGFEKDLTKYGDWELIEFLDSVAEINNDYIRCYNKKTSKIILLDVFHTPHGMVEKLYYSFDNKDDYLKLFQDVEKFDNEYLNIANAKDAKSGKEYYVLRHKINGKDISELSYSGQPYLMAGHKKESKLITLTPLLNMYIILFALSSLCRYHPDKWGPFVLNDSTGEKLLFEKFLFYARRIMPNYVLNIIEGELIQYTSSRYIEKDTVKLVGEHQIEEIVEHKINKVLRKDNYKKIINKY